MKKSCLLACIVFFVGCSLTLYAQDLSTVTVSDQFDSGERGGNLGLNNGGIEYYSVETQSNTDGITGTIVYKNAFAGQASKGGEVESPVLDVTVANVSPDRSFTLPTLVANTRPGASSPAKALYIGDDGGYNAISLGEASSSNYFLQVDMFCPNYSGVAGAGGQNFTRMGIAIRANYDVVPSVDGPSINTFPMGNYALMYESSLATIYAVKFSVQSSGTGDLRFVSLATTSPLFQIIASRSITDNGWHTLKIAADGATILFFVDGTQLGSDFFDISYPMGEAVLTYRASSAFDGNAATDTQAQFDNLIAGPFHIPASINPENWMLLN